MIINVKFQEKDKKIEADFAQNDSTVKTNFGEFQKVFETLTSETWTFTLEDGTTVEKAVIVNA